MTAATLFRWSAPVSRHGKLHAPVNVAVLKPFPVVAENLGSDAVGNRLPLEAGNARRLSVETIVCDALHAGSLGVDVHARSLPQVRP
jgi:hypothetical protein